MTQTLYAPMNKIKIKKKKKKKVRLFYTLSMGVGEKHELNSKFLYCSLKICFFFWHLSLEGHI
jgi:hypothetical protein